MPLDTIDIVYTITRIKDGKPETKEHHLTEKALIEMLSLFHGRKGNRRNINLETDKVEIIDII